MNGTTDDRHANARQYPAVRITVNPSREEVAQPRTPVVRRLVHRAIV